MAKVATTLFELGPGAELPSDADLRAIDKRKADDSKLAEILGDIDGIFLRLKGLDAEAKLAAARKMAGAFNGSTRMFNVAVFLRDKEGDESADLFATPAPLAEPELC